MVRNVVAAAADDRLYAGHVAAVDDILGGEQICRGNDDRAELVKGEDGEPELIVALEDDKNGVALADSEGGEIVGGAGGIFAQLAEVEDALVSGVVAPDHGALLGRDAGHLIDDVIGKIEVIRADRLKAVQYAVFVEADAAEFIIKTFQTHFHFPPFLRKPAPGIHILLRLPRSCRGRGRNRNRWNRRR